MVRTDDIRTERVNEEILLQYPCSKLISSCTINYVVVTCINNICVGPICIRTERVNLMRNYHSVYIPLREKVSPLMLWLLSVTSLTSPCIVMYVHVHVGMACTVVY